MDEIYTIYYNHYGMSFKWRRGAKKDLNKIQLAFRNTGLFLTLSELKIFANMIEHTIRSSIKCFDCNKNIDCKSLLLETPALQVSFVMSYNELLHINDLVKGTLFQIQLKTILRSLSIISNHN